MRPFGVEHWNDDTDLVYSPDDDGWYFQDYSRDCTSQVFTSKVGAARAWRRGTVKWDDD